MPSIRRPPSSYLYRARRLHAAVNPASLRRHSCTLPCSTTAPNTQPGTFLTSSSHTPSTLTASSIGKPFVPPTITLKEIHAAVPKDLLRKNVWLSAYYCVRDVACCAAIFYYGFHIEHILANIPLGAEWLVKVARAALWLAYWTFQGLSFASFFCLGASPVSRPYYKP